MRPRRPTSPAAACLVALALPLSGCGADADVRAPTAGRATSSTPGGPPWPAPVDDVADLVAEAGLDLGPMGTAEHYHPTLTVLVDGEAVPVAPNIGVDPATGAMSAVHTHEGDGTVHVEADTVGEVFTLGQLFTQWGVALEPDRVGDVRAEGGVVLTVDGRRVRGDPAALRLRPDQRIVVSVS